jgi:tetratricopeptide (TPR) repeat protein
MRVAFSVLVLGARAQTRRVAVGAQGGVAPSDNEEIQRGAAAMQRGMLLQQSERYEEAVLSYREALAIGKEVLAAEPARLASLVARASTNGGLSLQRLGRHDEALSHFDEVCGAVPGYADGHHNRGNALSAVSRPAEAAAAFGEAIRLAPKDAGSYFNLGNVLHAKMADHAAAARAFTAVLSLEPDDAAAAYNLANAQQELGQLDEALQNYAAATSAAPNDPDKRVNLGFALDAAGRFNEAASSFSRALALQPTDATAYVGLGHALKGAARMQQAADAYRSALALHPEEAGAYDGLGIALRETDPEGAAAAFAAAAMAGDGGPEKRQASELRAWLGEEAGKMEAAAEGRATPSATGTRAAQRYPDVFERGVRCPSADEAEAVAWGASGLLQRGPTVLRGATKGWAANAWGDEALLRAVGADALMNMLVMPTAVHPTLEAGAQGENESLVEPAHHGVYWKDYLKVLDLVASAKPRSAADFAVYVAQLNLLQHLSLLKQVCLPRLLPADRLSTANLWVGGALMKNGLHFDNFDNLLHQLVGTKTALLFPPHDTPNLRYGAARIKRHSFSVPAGFANATVFESVRRARIYECENCSASGGRVGRGLGTALPMAGAPECGIDQRV